jgi:hypothetical protein
MNAGNIRRPLSGALMMDGGLPGVPLRSTPGFIRTHLRRSIEPRAFAAHGDLAWPRMVKARSGTKGFSSAALSGRWLNRPGATTQSQFRDGALALPATQRRRREGVKPGVERSETPGNHSKQYLEPLTRGDGKTIRVQRSRSSNGKPCAFNITLSSSRNETTR